MLELMTRSEEFSVLARSFVRKGRPDKPLEEKSWEEVRKGAINQPISNIIFGEEYLNKKLQAPYAPFVKHANSSQATAKPAGAEQNPLLKVTKQPPLEQRAR